jgi:hypothetical protein
MQATELSRLLGSGSGALALSIMEFRVSTLTIEAALLDPNPRIYRERPN